MDNNSTARSVIDYEKGVSNCLGDKDFYKKLLSMFLQDDCFKRAKAARDAKDNQALFACMHELKGVSGNAALSGLYTAVVPLVELLRHGTPTDAEVATLFASVELIYSLTCAEISEILKQ